jgi:hypothetical protein
MAHPRGAPPRMVGPGVSLKALPGTMTRGLAGFTGVRQHMDAWLRMGVQAFPICAKCRQLKPCHCPAEDPNANHGVDQRVGR